MRWHLVTAAAVLLTAAAAEETCLSSDEEPYLLFGAKTAYTFAKTNTNTDGHEVHGCQPKAFWLMSRHGSNNPEADEIPGLMNLVNLRDSILQNYDRKKQDNSQDRMCRADIELLHRWRYEPQHNMTYAGDLSSDGYMAALNAGQAWRRLYPNVVTENRKDYLFKYVKDRRSTEFFRAFTEGLFRTQADGYGIHQENDEKILRPYKFCPAWVRQVEENNETLSQLRIFQNKLDYKEMISNVSRRLGYKYELDAETIHHIYDMCRYNKAWDVIPVSPWCAAFTREDLKRLEYAEDLELYYKYGAGTPLNAQIGCSLVKDMMDFFDKHISNPGTPVQPLSVVQLTEAAPLLALYAALALPRQRTPLTADNYHTPQIQNRAWRTSTLTPFDASLAAVLYKCEVGSKSQVNEEYQVLFLKNDQVMHIDHCRVGLCDWSLLQAQYGDVAKQCNMDFCNGATSPNSVLALAISGLYFILKLAF